MARARESAIACPCASAAALVALVVNPAVAFTLTERHQPSSPPPSAAVTSLLLPYRGCCTGWDGSWDGTHRMGRDGMGWDGTGQDGAGPNGLSEILSHCIASHRIASYRVVSRRTTSCRIVSSGIASGQAQRDGQVQCDGPHHMHARNQSHDASAVHAHTHIH